MSEGVGWSGWAIWPESLASHIGTLDDLIRTAEEAAARVRGLNAEPRVERLRADVEACWLLLRRGAEIYRSGTLANYRTVEGKPVPPGATGRDVTAALRADDENHLRQASGDFTHLIRSCLYQLGRKDDARAYEGDWPTTRAEVLDGDPKWQVPEFPPGTHLAPPFGDW